MSRREKDRKQSIDALLNFVPPEEIPQAPAKPPPRPAPARAPPAPKAPPPAPAKKAPPLKPRDPFEGRQAKAEEQKRLRERRENELFRSQNLKWRGMGGFKPFEWAEQKTLAERLHDSLGAPGEKEGRVKNRERGKRQGGRG